MRAIGAGYAATAVVFLGLDLTWLSVMGDAFYRPMLGELLAAKPDLAAAAAFYAVYITGVAIFAVAPALAAGRRLIALRNGGLLGLVAYATYDLTNQATLAGWPPLATAVDLAWGALVTGTAATAGALAGSALSSVRRRG
jgi:uncharacterized membrane protein